ncbi:hypothetical protein PENSPDRAFT_568092 [Peniophora sp. CONT]|nr:hypothetical protein PENSPDRAFT_568092 [Peniophora sp. CONT]
MAYCERCDRYFPHMRALENHERDSAQHNICHSCNIDFATWVGLKEHYVQSPRHHYCQHCNIHFNSDGQYLDHLDQSHWACLQHRRIFTNEYGLNEHYRQHPDHQTNHPYCAECDKCFASQANLQAHLNSRRHVQAAVRCPGAQCGRTFVKASDLVQHFEGGTCPSGMTRARLNQEIVRRDRNNIITNPNRLLTGPDGSRSAPEPSYLATERSWNGWAYECFLCSRTFTSLTALNQHLRSPAHATKIFRCPNSECMRQCSALSALVQHVEHDRCGIRQNSRVQGLLDGVVSGMGRIAL